MGRRRNIGLVDMLIRIFIGLLMIYFGFIDNSFIEDKIASTMLGAIGSLSVLVALIGYCPFYTLIGYNSCGHKNDS